MFKVNIPQKLYAKIMYFVDKSSIEISMMARIKHDEENSMTITNVYLVEQENSSAETEMSDAAIAKLLYSTRNDEGMLNCWIHSHVNMGVFWSGTDHAAMRQIGGNGYCVSLVFNKKRDVKCAYYQGKDSFKPAVFADNIEVKIVEDIHADVYKSWEKEYIDKCKTAAPISYHKGIHYGSILTGRKHVSDKVEDSIPTRMIPHDTSYGKRTSKKETLKACSIPPEQKKDWWKDFLADYMRPPRNAKELDEYFENYSWEGYGNTESVTGQDVESEYIFQEDNMNLTKRYGGIHV